MQSEWAHHHPWPPPTLLVLDFDGTITKSDTISALFSSVLAIQKERGDDFSSAHASIVEHYMDDLNHHIANYPLPAEQRKSFNDEITYQRSLKAVEETSFKRVSESGIFKGLTKSDLEDIGRKAVENDEVGISPGFPDMFSRLGVGGGTKVIILSVNFSGSWIRGVLAGAGVDVNGGDIAEIVANEISPGGAIVGPHGGEIMVTSDAKLRELERVVREWRRSSDETEKYGRTFYIGDSATDMECLRSEEVEGIVICEDGAGKLTTLFEKVGVDDQLWAKDFEELIFTLW